MLVITGEYSSGMIRATLDTVPQRRLVLTAKALVLAAARWPPAVRYQPRGAGSALPVPPAPP